MYAKEFMKALQVAINAEVPLWVWGQAGIGKSSIIRKVASILKRKHIDVRPTQMDPVDMGIPYIDGGVCKRAIPNWLPSDGNTLIAIEELPDAPVSVQTALYQLTLERTLADYKLPDGAYICATGNRAQDGGNYNQPPAPLMNRFVHITLESAFDSWLEWASAGDSNTTCETLKKRPISPNIRPEIRAFFAWRKDLLVQQPHKTDFAFCTPRSVEFLSRVLDQEPTDDIAGDLIRGCIGQGTGLEFIGFQRIWRSLPQLSSIISSPDSCPLPTDLSESFATAIYLSSHWTKENSKPLTAYAMRLAPEFGCLYLKDVCKRDKAAPTSKPILDMLSKDKYSNLMF
jgi:hypothetical protein